MAFQTPEVSIQLTTTEAMQLEGSVVAASQSADPIAMPPATAGRSSVLRRRRLAKCTPCARAKKRKYKVLNNIWTRDFSYKQCDVDPNDPHGPCLDCKTRGRERDCDRVLNLHPRTRPMRSTPQDTEMDPNFEKLRNEVDSLKLSFNDFQNTVSSTLGSIQQTLSILLPTSNSTGFTSQPSFLHDQ